MKKYLVAEFIKQVIVLTHKPSTKDLVKAHLTLRHWSYQEVLAALVEANIEVFYTNLAIHRAAMEADFDEARMDVIGQNGNDGMHYE